LYSSKGKSTTQQNAKVLLSINCVLANFQPQVTDRLCATTAGLSATSKIRSPALGTTGLRSRTSSFCLGQEFWQFGWRSVLTHNVRHPASGAAGDADPG
jgi:hypothetical protein